MRMFFNVIKKSYTLLRQNLVILQPLILFMLIMTITLSSLNNIQKGISPAIVVLAVCCFCMIGAFLAGWYPLFTKVIENSYNTSSTPQEKAYMSIQTLTESEIILLQNQMATDHHLLTIFSKLLI